MAATRHLRADGVDIGRSLWQYSLWPTDPTSSRQSGRFVRACLTPEGPGTLAISHNQSGDIEVDGFGPGRDWLIESAPGLLGLLDDPSEFRPVHPLIRRIWHEHPGVRLPKSGLIWQELLMQIVGQRISTAEAAQQWTRLVRLLGEPAPGPFGLTLPPTPSALVGTAYWELHRLDIERKRADALTAAARAATALEAAAGMAAGDAIDRICAVRGLGPWSATFTVTLSHGDPDVVVVGDYGMPCLVTWNLSGRSLRDDSVMLELLEPERPQRGRVVQLLFAGASMPPRRAPRQRFSRISRL
jgi:3-methyladenine DNA glycosylase/8-oxoguanine DNA glycosylase